MELGISIFTNLHETARKKTGYPRFLKKRHTHVYIYMAMDQYLSIPFLGGWTSIYQLFWCSPGVQVLTHCHIYIYVYETLCGIILCCMIHEDGDRHQWCISYEESGVEPSAPPQTGQPNEEILGVCWWIIMVKGIVILHKWKFAIT